MFPTFIHRCLTLSFWFHDWLSDWLASHFILVKRVLLVVAHLSLFGFLFPTWRSEFGSAGGNLLIVILFLSPLSKIFRMRLLQQLMGLRRELGILFGYLVTVHGLGYAIDQSFAPVLEQALVTPLWSGQNPVLLGLIAYGLTLPLLFTSNNLATRLLGGSRWKRLHRIVYIMALLAVLHRFTIRGMDLWSLTQAMMLIVAYIGVKLLAWRNFLAPLRQLIDWVGEQYAAYRATRQETPASAPATLG